jgi:hypothetical protein
MVLEQDACTGGQRRLVGVKPDRHEDDARVPGDILQRGAGVCQLGCGDPEPIVARQVQHLAPVRQGTYQLDVAWQLRGRAIDDHLGIHQGGIVCRACGQLDQLAVDRLDRIFGGQGVAALPFANHVGAGRRRSRPQALEAGPEIEKVPRFPADEVDVFLGGLCAVAVFGSELAVRSGPADAPDRVFVRRAQAVFHRCAAPDHHDHHMVADVGRVMPAYLFTSDACIARPDLARVSEEGELVRGVRGNPGGILGRAMHEEPFGEGQEGLLDAAALVRGDGAVVRVCAAKAQERGYKQREESVLHVRPGCA